MPGHLLDDGGRVMSGSARHFRRRTLHREIIRLRELGCTCRPKVVDASPPPIPGAVCVQHDVGCPLGDAVRFLELTGLQVAVGFREPKGCAR